MCIGFIHAVFFTHMIFWSLMIKNSLSHHHVHQFRSSHFLCTLYFRLLLHTQEGVPGSMVFSNHMQKFFLCKATHICCPLLLSILHLIWLVDNLVHIETKIGVLWLNTHTHIAAATEQTYRFLEIVCKRKAVDLMTVQLFSIRYWQVLE